MTLGAHALVGDGDAHVQPLPSDVPTLSVSSSDESEGEKEVGEGISGRTRSRLANRANTSPPLNLFSVYITLQVKLKYNFHCVIFLLVGASSAFLSGTWY